mgnify:FL=1
MKSGNGFYVSKSNRRGVLLLLLVVLVIAFVPRVYFLIKGPKSIVVTQEIIDLSEQKSEERRNRANYSRKKRSKFKTPPSKFDPNTYDLSDWMNLGLSEKQAGVILKFAKRGIRSPEDLKRIFVISDELFVLIKDSLVFNLSTTEKLYSRDLPEKKKVKVEVNLADKDQLMAISGIGDYVSERIILYRERLGGFVMKEQLMEIKKIDLEFYSRIEDQLIVDPAFVRKMNLNSAELEELKNHPYISWNVANSIVKMRTQKGGFTKLEDLLESVLIDRELYEKIKPYLSL